MEYPLLWNISLFVGQQMKRHWTIFPNRWAPTAEAQGQCEHWLLQLWVFKVKLLFLCILLDCSLFVVSLKTRQSLNVIKNMSLYIRVKDD